MSTPLHGESTLVLKLDQKVHLAGGFRKRHSPGRGAMTRPLPLVARTSQWPSPPAVREAARRDETHRRHTVAVYTRLHRRRRVQSYPSWEWRPGGNAVTQVSHDPDHEDGRTQLVDFGLRTQTKAESSQRSCGRNGWYRERSVWQRA